MAFEKSGESRNIEPENDAGFTVNNLTDAAMSNDIDLALTCLLSGVNPNDRDMYDNTALSVAVMYENFAIVRLLLAFHADPNITDRYGNYPIQYSITAPNAEIFQLLILHGSIIPIIEQINEELNRLN